MFITVSGPIGDELGKEVQLQTTVTQKLVLVGHDLTLHLLPLQAAAAVLERTSFVKRSLPAP